MSSHEDHVRMYPIDQWPPMGLYSPSYIRESLAAFDKQKQLRVKRPLERTGRSQGKYFQFAEMFQFTSHSPGGDVRLACQCGRAHILTPNQMAAMADWLWTFVKKE